MQRALAVFINLHPGAQQVVVQQAGCDFDDRHVGLALQDQAHIHAALRGFAQLLEQAVAGKKIGVGDQDPVARRADGNAVVTFDVAFVLAVVARDQERHGLACRWQRSVRREFRLAPEQPITKPGRLALANEQLAASKVLDVAHQRPLNFNRVVLFGGRTEVNQVVVGVVDATDKGATTVDHDDLAVHAPEQVGAVAPQPGAGVKHVDPHAGLCQGRDKGG